MPIPRPISGRLRFRVAALLALALLPIGLVGLVLTREFMREVRNGAELSLAAMTERVVFGERQTLDRAIGALEALRPIVDRIRNNPEVCRNYLREYMNANVQYSFVGFIPTSRIMTCSSADDVVDLTDNERLLTRNQAPAFYIDALDQPSVSGQPVLNLLQPVYDEQAFAGYLSVSVPIAILTDQPDREIETAPLGVTLFNAQGNVLTVQVTSDDRTMPMPRDLSLVELASRPSGVFEARTDDGEMTIFVSVPVIPGAAYALVAWPPSALVASTGSLSVYTSVFPLVMWVVTLLVTFLAVDRLVAQYVGKLSIQMRDFARTRKLPRENVTAGAASELQALETAFVDMAYALINDEARMEGALREKNVLLKEVHHRVKNNLQLISSIMNMNMRSARSPETISVLRTLQERVLGLATVHRNLYQTENVSRTNGAVLLRDLLTQVIAAGSAPGSGIETTMNFDDVTLLPDQAVPLSMLATELATNALKHLGTTNGAQPWIHASMENDENGRVVFEFANSMGEVTMHPDGEESGLGSKLIRAFAMQLGGTIETVRLDDSYKTIVEFEVNEFSADLMDA